MQVEGLLFIGLLVFVAKIFEEAFKKVRLPTLAGAVLAGIVLGPPILSIVKPEEEILLFLGVGINFMLFLAGLEEFDVVAIRSSVSKRLFFGGILLIAFPAFSIFMLLKIFNVDSLAALFIGVLLAMSCVGPLTKIISDLGLRKTHVGAETFTINSLNEILGIFILSALLQASMRAGTNLGMIVAESLLKVGLFIAVTVAFSHYLLTPFLKVVEKNMVTREAMFAIIISLVFIVSYWGEVSGIHGAFGAFILGVMLSKFVVEEGRIEISERLHAFTYGFFEPLFFAGVGLYLTVVFNQNYMLMIFLLILATLASKFLAGYLSSKYSRFTNPLFTSFSTLSMGGIDVAFLISGLTLGLISQELYSVTLLIVLIIVFFTPFTLKFLSRKMADVTHVDDIEDVSKFYVQRFFNKEKVSDIPSADLVVVQAGDSLVKAKGILDTFKLDTLTVVSKTGRLLGSIFRYDLEDLTFKELESLCVKDKMRKLKVTVTPNESVATLIDRMRVNDVDTVAVVDNTNKNKLLRIITEKDIINFLVKH